MVVGGVAAVAVAAAVVVAVPAVVAVAVVGVAVVFVVVVVAVAVAVAGVVTESPVMLLTKPGCGVRPAMTGTEPNIEIFLTNCLCNI